MSVRTIATSPRRPAPPSGRDGPIRNLPLVRVLSWGLLGSSLVAAGGSLLFPGLLRGTDVLDGNLRGTAFVMLLVALPLLVVGLRRISVGDARGLVVLTGATAYLAYQGVMFCFATPFNDLFLAYVALLGLAVWSLVCIVANVDVAEVRRWVGPRMPFRSVSGALVVFAALNALAWLARIVPAVVGDQPAAGIEDSGLPTSPVWVQDLAIWIPAALAAAVAMWRRDARGVLLTNALLLFYAVECVSVASDQWWGARADSTEPALASMSVVPGALLAAAVVSVPLLWSLRHFHRTPAIERKEER